MKHGGMRPKRPELRRAPEDDEIQRTRNQQRNDAVAYSLQEMRTDMHEAAYKQRQAQSHAEYSRIGGIAAEIRPDTAVEGIFVDKSRPLPESYRHYAYSCCSKYAGEAPPTDEQY